MLIGIVGTGFVGSAYARYFIGRGFKVVQYSLEPEFIQNKAQISKADLVLIAVPTPTTPQGIDLSAVSESIRLVGPTQIAILKSTLPPGAAQMYQDMVPNIKVISSPEFLSVETADADVANPFVTLIGTTTTPTTRDQVQGVNEFLAAMPHNPDTTLILPSTEAELLKYAHNVSGFLNVLLYNILYDVARHSGSNWDRIQGGLKLDPYLASHYSHPLHKQGRGAGGPCFIKDFEAFRRIVGDHPSADFLKAAASYNNDLLSRTGKDTVILDSVYPPISEELS